MWDWIAGEAEHGEHCRGGREIEVVFGGVSRVGVRDRVRRNMIRGAEWNRLDGVICTLLGGHVVEFPAEDFAVEGFGAIEVNYGDLGP
jgi:hypothetical protein